MVTTSPDKSGATPSNSTCDPPPQHDLEVKTENLAPPLKPEPATKEKLSPGSDPNALLKLGKIIENENIATPSEEEEQKFLKEIDALKKKNEQGKLLGVIDQIIFLTKECKILDQDINHSIPDSIVTLHREGNNIYEYIIAPVTKKWIEYKFQIQEGGQYVMQLKTSHLVQITDTLDKMCDIMGLLIMHNSAMRRNRIIPEYLAKNEALVPLRPPAVADYSAFKGHYAAKKRTTTPLPMKVSSIFIILISNILLYH